MENFQIKAQELNNKHKKRGRWTSVVSVFASITLFCTVYALIIPASTTSADVYCGFEEHAEHSDECFEEVKTLICSRDDIVTVHTHSEACYEEHVTFICTNDDPDHVHDDNCFRSERVLICGADETAAHVHDESCYKIEKTLKCKKTIHKHSLQCFSNPSADVESESVWMRTFQNVKLSGKWSEDVIAIAKSQVGYRESTSNYRVLDDGKTMKGYTRYGAWYGDKYGDWCAMFCSFCINYANVDRSKMPIDSNCNDWIDTLSSSKYNLYHSNDGKYTPKSGDLIFFDWNKDGSVDHVGFVSDISRSAKRSNTKIETIEGNSGDKVCINTYDINDSCVLGFGEMPQNKDSSR